MYNIICICHKCLLGSAGCIYKCKCVNAYGMFCRVRNLNIEMVMVYISSFFFLVGLAHKARENEFP